MHPNSADEAGTPHPVFFAAMMTPYGLTGGFVTVTLGYLLSHAGVSVAAIGAAMAIFISMAAWKVLWAPLVDASLTYRAWYLIGAVGSCAAMLSLCFVRMDAAATAILTLLFAVLGFFQSLTAMSTDGLVSNLVGSRGKGRAGGWVQAGSLGGAGLGGGGGLWMATHVSLLAAGVALAVLALSASLAVLRLSEPAHAHRRPEIVKTLEALWEETVGLARGRTGALAIFLLLLPLGTGAASNLFASIAKDFGATAETVALVTGVLAGIVAIPASLAGGYLADRIGRRTVYWGGAALMALSAAGLAAAPKTPDMFVLFSMSYATCLGVIWGAFSGVVYEAAGRGAAATKCNLLAGLSNVPIASMTALDGWAQSHWGTSAMLNFEAAVAAVAIAVYIGVERVTRPKLAMAASAALSP